MEESVRNAVKRGVFIYGYLNAGALEKERPYYQQFKHLRLAPYDGWKDYPDSSGGRMIAEIVIVILIGLLFVTLGCAIHDHNEHYSNLFK